MIKKLYEAGCFDYKKFIIDNLKALSLNNDEAIVLIKLLDLYYKNKKVTFNDISKELPIIGDIVDSALTKLSERGFYEMYVNFNNGLGEECISLDGTFDKVEAILENKNVDNDNEIFLVNQYLTKKINRILTSNELDIISSLINEDKYTLNDFKKSIEYLEKKHRVINIKTITNGLEDCKISKVEVEPSNTLIKDFFNGIK